jgi:hypothetical protein
MLVLLRLPLARRCVDLLAVFAPERLPAVLVRAMVVRPLGMMSG